MVGVRRLKLYRRLLHESECAVPKPQPFLKLRVIHGPVLQLRLKALQQCGLNERFVLLKLVSFPVFAPVSLVAQATKLLG